MNKWNVAVRKYISPSGNWYIILSWFKDVRSSSYSGGYYFTKTKGGQPWFINYIPLHYIFLLYWSHGLLPVQHMRRLQCGEIQCITLNITKLCVFFTFTVNLFLLPEVLDQYCSKGKNIKSNPTYDFTRSLEQWLRRCLMTWQTIYSKTNAPLQLVV